MDRRTMIRTGAAALALPALAGLRDAQAHDLWSFAAEVARLASRLEAETDMRRAADAAVAAWGDEVGWPARRGPGGCATSRATITARRGRAIGRGRPAPGHCPPAARGFRQCLPRPAIQPRSKPAVSSSARVSNSGRPITPEWLPASQPISASARP